MVLCLYNWLEERKQPNSYVLKRRLILLACLLINNCDNYLIEFTELLAFYSYKWELGDSREVYIDFDSIGDRIHVLIYELKHREIGARIGIAPTRLASFAAAHAAAVEAPLFIPQTQLQEFLAEQSISYLPISDKSEERLRTLGLQTLGQVADVDVRTLVNQFGRAGKLMSELSRGIDSTPLPSQRPTIGTDRGAWQMGIWDDREDVKTHRQLIPINVVLGDTGYPEARLVDDMGFLSCETIDIWTIENKWWTEQKTNCEYFEVIECGAGVTSTYCHDLDHGKWWYMLLR